MNIFTAHATVLASDGTSLVAVLVIIAIVVVAILMSVIPRAIGKAVDKTVYSSEIQKGKSFVSQSTTFTSTLTLSEIRDRIFEKVTAADASTGINAVMYIKENSASRMLFAYGNRLADHFQVELQLAEKNGGSTAILKVLNWKELDSGLIVGHEYLDLLRRQVEAVFQTS